MTIFADDTVEHKVVIEDMYDAIGWLQCPCCKNNYLHHAGATFYDRLKEDSDETVVTHVRQNSLSRVLAHRANASNPSSRRDGIIIDFWCELCEDMKLELCISQHKGNTHIYWRVREKVLGE